MATCVTAISLLTALPLWLFVESPFTELIKYISSNSPQEKKQNINSEYKKNVENNTYL